MSAHMTVVSPLAAFARWWFSELKACVPAKLRLGRARSRLTIEIRDDEAIFMREDGADVHLVGRAEVSEPGHPVGPRNIRQVFRKVKKASETPEVLLPQEYVLRQVVALPAEAVENLREVLAFEMDRHTPFKAEEVYYDYRLLAAEPGSGHVRVDLLVAIRERVDRALDLVRACGLEPAAVGVSSGDDRRAETFNLMPTLPSTRSKAWQRINAVLVLSCLVLLGAAIMLPLRAQQEALERAEHELAAVRAEALKVDDLRAQIAALIERAELVVEWKSGVPTVSRLLDDVSRRLPDDTWLVQFSRRGDQLSFAGFSGKASALIGLLEDSDYFADVQFSAPVTLDPRVGRERFNMTAAIETRGQLR